MNQRIFLFVGFEQAKDIKAQLVKCIQDLKGIYYECENYISSCTHLVCVQPWPVCKQKFLCASASGTWIVVPEYLLDSRAKGEWLPEEEYEWGSCIRDTMAIVDPQLPHEIIISPHRNRQRILHTGEMIFSTWKVAVLIEDDRKRDAYETILHCGGAKVLKPKLPLKNPSKTVRAATYLFVERQIPNASQLFVVTEGGILISTDYIRNCILCEFPRDAMEFDVSKYVKNSDGLTKTARKKFIGHQLQIQCVRLSKSDIQWWKSLADIEECQRPKHKHVEERFEDLLHETPPNSVIKNSTITQEVVRPQPVQQTPPLDRIVVTLKVPPEYRAQMRYAKQEKKLKFSGIGMLKSEKMLAVQHEHAKHVEHDLIKPHGNTDTNTSIEQNPQKHSNCNALDVSNLVGLYESSTPTALETEDVAREVITSQILAKESVIKLDSAINKLNHSKNTSVQDTERETITDIARTIAEETGYFVAEGLLQENDGIKITESLIADKDRDTSKCILNKLPKTDIIHDVIKKCPSVVERENSACENLQISSELHLIEERAHTLKQLDVMPKQASYHSLKNLHLTPLDQQTAETIVTEVQEEILSIVVPEPSLCCEVSYESQEQGVNSRTNNPEIIESVISQQSSDRAIEPFVEANATAESLKMNETPNVLKGYSSIAVKSIEATVMSDHTSFNRVSKPGLTKEVMELHKMQDVFEQEIINNLEADTKLNITEEAQMRIQPETTIMSEVTDELETVLQMVTQVQPEKNIVTQPENTVKCVEPNSLEEIEKPIEEAAYVKSEIEASQNIEMLSDVGCKECSEAQINLKGEILVGSGSHIGNVETNVETREIIETIIKGVEIEANNDLTTATELKYSSEVNVPLVKATESECPVTFEATIERETYMEINILDKVKEVALKQQQKFVEPEQVNEKIRENMRDTVIKITSVDQETTDGLEITVDSELSSIELPASEVPTEHCTEHDPYINSEVTTVTSDERRMQPEIIDETLTVNQKQWNTESEIMVTESSKLGLETVDHLRDSTLEIDTPVQPQALPVTELDAKKECVILQSIVEVINQDISEHYSLEESKDMSDKTFNLVLNSLELVDNSVESEYTKAPTDLVSMKSADKVTTNLCLLDDKFSIQSETSQITVMQAEIPSFVSLELEKPEEKEIVNSSEILVATEEFKTFMILNQDNNNIEKPVEPIVFNSKSEINEGKLLVSEIVTVIESESKIYLEEPNQTEKLDEAILITLPLAKEDKEEQHTLLLPESPQQPLLQISKDLSVDKASVQSVIDFNVPLEKDEYLPDLMNLNSSSFAMQNEDDENQVLQLKVSEPWTLAPTASEQQAKDSVSTPKSLRSNTKSEQTTVVWNESISMPLKVRRKLQFSGATKFSPKSKVLPDHDQPIRVEPRKRTSNPINLLPTKKIKDSNKTNTNTHKDNASLKNRLGKASPSLKRKAEKVLSYSASKVVPSSTDGEPNDQLVKFIKKNMPERPVWGSPFKIDQINVLSSKKEMELPRALVQLLKECMEESRSEAFIDYCTSLSIYTWYPDLYILNTVIRIVLLNPEDANCTRKSNDLLWNLYYSHPPVLPHISEVYLKALTIQKDKIVTPWETLSKILSGCLLNQWNCNSLLDFYVNVIAMDFQAFILRSTDPVQALMTQNTKNPPPILVSILWPSGGKYSIGKVSVPCTELLGFLSQAQRCKDTYQMFRDLLQLMEYVIECFRLCDKTKPQDPIGPKSQALVYAFVSQNGTTEMDNTMLEELLAHLEVDWFVLAVALETISRLPYLQFPEKGYSTPMSLQKVISYYFKPSVKLLNSESLKGAKPTDREIRAKRMPECPDSPYPLKWHKEFISPLKASTVNRQNRRGETALHTACMKNQPDKLLVLLNTPGIDVNIADYAGWTALHEASNHGHLDCVKLLLEWKPPKRHSKRLVSRPIDLFATNQEGLSVLHDAVLNNHVEVAELLLQHGGKKLSNLRNKKGYTPADMAESVEMRAFFNRFSKCGSSFLHSTVSSDESKNNTLLDVIQMKCYLRLLYFIIRSYKNVMQLSEIELLVEKVNKHKGTESNHPEVSPYVEDVANLIRGSQLSVKEVLTVSADLLNAKTMFNHYQTITMPHFLALTSVNAEELQNELLCLEIDMHM